MLSIMTGTYDKVSSVSQLKKIPVSDRQWGKLSRSDRWKGIQHGELVETVWKVLDELYSFKPLNPIFAVAPNGSGFIGGFELGREVGSNGSKTIEPMIIEGIPQKTSYAMGLKHSNDSRSALKTCIGGRVAICDNGMVSASEVWKRKHTIGLNLRDWLTEKLANFMDQRQLAGSLSAALAEHEITKRNWDDLVLRLCREEIIPWRMGGWMDYWWTSARDEGSIEWIAGPDEDNGMSPEEASQAWDFQSTAWDAYNVVNHTLKEIPPAKQLEKLQLAYNCCLDLLPQNKRPDNTPVVAA